MKIRILITLLLSVLLLTGCSATQTEEKLDAVEDTVEARMDAVEDAVETMLQIQPTQPPATTVAPPATTSGGSAALTKEEAEAIALEHAGFAADQVSYLHTEYEIDDGRPQYEVSFHQDRWEYDYEIDAETGRILSFEKDD